MDAQQAVKAIGWLGETWGFWIQTGAFFLSALGAIAVIYYNGKQARLRALIDHIVHQKTDKELVEATRPVNALHGSGQARRGWARRVPARRVPARRGRRGMARHGEARQG